MLKKLLTLWHPMRLLRMALSIAAIIQGIVQKDYAIAIMGILFALATIFNIGCCNPGNTHCSGKCDTN